MKIAHVAPMWNTVPPRIYGGTERVIAFLADTQTEMGHDVTLFAAGGSTTKAKLHVTMEVPLIDRGLSWGDMFNVMDNTSTAFSMAGQFDVIHCHSHLIGGIFQHLIKTPVIHTMHTMPKESDWRWELFDKYKDVYNPAFISEGQRDRCPIKFPTSHVVHNGIDTSQFEFNANPEEYFTWVGLITRVKGLDNAIQACKKLGVKLKFAGKIDEANPISKQFFEETIKPQIGGDIEYMGELKENELSDLYRGAKALLYPIEFNEPFGLVMAESMACGTPVIVNDRGSVREIVEDGKTGFVVQDMDGLVEKMKNIDQIDRAACRRHVEDNFSKEVMSKRYLQMYEEVIARSNG